VRRGLSALGPWKPSAPGRGAPTSALVALTAAAVPAIALLSVRQPRLTAAAAIGLAALALAVRHFTAAVLLFTMLTFFERASWVSGSPSAIKLLTVALLFSWIGLLATRQWGPALFRDHPLLTALAILLAAWAGASLLWAADETAATSGAWRLVQMVLLPFLVYTAIRDRRDLRMFAWALIVAGVLTTIAGLLILRAGAESGGRFGGYLGNPNNLAAVLLPGLALTGLLLQGSRRGFERRLLAACGLVLLLSFFLTESRGGLIGLGVMCVVALAFAGPARARVVGLVAVLAVVGVTYFTVFAPQAARQRITSYSSATSTGRSDLWSVARLMFENHPVRGVGIDNFTVLAPAYLERDLNITRSDLILRPDATEVHNTYLNVLAELGLVGGLLFVGLLAGVLAVACRATRALARAGDRQTELMARGLVIGASGMLTAYFFFSAQFEKPLWIVLGALAALSTVARGSEGRSARRQA